MFCCRATSWDSGVCLICYTMLYRSCRSYRYRLFATSGVVYWQIIAGSSYVVCCVYVVLCLFSGDGSRGMGLPTCGGWGGLLMFLLFLRVASL